MKSIVALTSVLLAASPLFAEPPPAELLQARESYQRSQQQVLTPVERRYLENLVSLRKRFTQAGNLQAALAVDAEIKTVQSRMAAGAVPSVAPVATPMATPAPSNPESAAFPFDNPVENNPFIGEWAFKFANGSVEHRTVRPNGKVFCWLAPGKPSTVWGGFYWKLIGGTLEIYDAENTKRQLWTIGPDGTISAVSTGKPFPGVTKASRAKEAWGRHH